MVKSLKEIRERLLKEENKANTNFTRDNSIFAHWNIPDNSRVITRFLPDGNDENDFFWLERQMIKLPFTGVAGQDEKKDVTVQVPCVEMWGLTCPVHKEIRPWFKSEDTEDLARTYWKKRSYLFQGFVVNSPIEEEDTPESPIRRFVISPQIFKIISSALMDPEFGDNLPTDFENGTDFIIKKTQSGKYSDYTTSNWSKRERALTEEERDAVETWGLYDLNDFMPKKPTTEELDIIMELFEDSVDGKLYDLEKYGEYYKPWGIEKEKADGDTPASPKPSQQTTTDTSDDEPVESKVEEETPSTSGSKVEAKDILAAIRNRKPVE